MGEAYLPESLNPHSDRPAGAGLSGGFRSRFMILFVCWPTYERSVGEIAAKKKAVVATGRKVFRREA